MKNPLYVAVVFTEDGKSLAPDGTFASFVHRNRTKAIKRAVEAARKWEARNFRIDQTRASADREYTVLVGELTEAVIPAPQYDVLPIVRKPRKPRRPEVSQPD